MEIGTNIEGRVVEQLEEPPAATRSQLLGQPSLLAVQGTKMSMGWPPQVTVVAKCALKFMKKQSAWRTLKGLTNVLF